MEVKNALAFSSCVHGVMNVMAIRIVSSMDWECIQTFLRYLLQVYRIKQSAVINIIYKNLIRVQVFTCIVM